MIISKRFILFFLVVLTVSIVSSLLLMQPTAASEPSAPAVAPLAQYDCGYLVGEIRMWPGQTPPDGWMFADGRAVSRITYAELFSVLGEAYGAGDGVNTFNLPDLRGRVPVGQDDMGGTAANRVDNSTAASILGGSAGEEQHTLTVNEMPSHTHTLDGHAHSAGGGAYGHTAGGAWLFQSFNKSMSYSGGGQAHNNMPPYLTINYIIRVSNGHQQ